jgi:hypothetical protein
MKNVIEFKRKPAAPAPEAKKRERKRSDILMQPFEPCQALKYPNLRKGHNKKTIFFIGLMAQMLREAGVLDQYQPFLEALAEDAREAILKGNVMVGYSDDLVYWFNSLCRTNK